MADETFTAAVFGAANSIAEEVGNVSLINKQTKDVTKPDAEATLALAYQWLAKCQEDPVGKPLGGSDLALISIAASLREIAQKLR